ncbi:GA-binding protein subunit beta-2 [Spea bombifrons]|uniref:GA-binding protein subunit beta-2 n=1 Tax=Spea bombifrons TaxID=233779 RepID=UPI00234AF72D|nr:GA-binding protein subunit beta-2 [Spea bombifrons]
MELDLGKRLLEAACNGEDEEVRLLIHKRAPFTTDWLGTSPLHMAAQNGHYATVKVLLEAGISRDARTKVDKTPLHMAATVGHLDIVDLLVQNGANVNARDMLKMTALHWAAENNHTDVANLLIKGGSDVNALSKFDKSAFDIALDKNNHELMIIIQEAMQGDIQGESFDSNAASVSSPEYVLASSDLTSVSDFVTASGRDTHFTNSDSVLATFAAIAEAASPVSASNNAPHCADQDSLAASALASIQEHVENGDERVITIIADAIPIDGLQGGLTTSHINHPLLMAIQNGHQVIAVPEDHVIEETVAAEQMPPAKKYRLESISDETAEPQDSNGDQAIKALQQKLHEANCRAQEYRQQLMDKEQEAEGYRVRLESLAVQHVNWSTLMMMEEGGVVIVSSEQLETTEVTEVETVEYHCDVPMESYSSKFDVSADVSKIGRLLAYLYV